jgi:hypothetical protein
MLSSIYLEHQWKMENLIRVSQVSIFKYLGTIIIMPRNYTLTLLSHIIGHGQFGFILHLPLGGPKQA